MRMPCATATRSAASALPGISAETCGAPISLARSSAAEKTGPMASGWLTASGPTCPSGLM
jgi:hypothetical protein